MSLFLWGGSSSPWLLCRKLRSCRFLFSAWPGWAPMGSRWIPQGLQSARSLRPAASEETKISDVNVVAQSGMGKDVSPHQELVGRVVRCHPNQKCRSGFSPDRSWKVEQTALCTVCFGFCHCCVGWTCYYFRGTFWKLKLAALSPKPLKMLPYEGAELKVKGCFRCNWLLWSL